MPRKDALTRTVNCDTEAVAPVIVAEPVRSPSGDATTALIRAIAMDIGKEVVHHIETMYPDAAEKLPSSGKLSIRNYVHNEIMAAIQVTDEGEIVARLRDRKAFRRMIKKAWADIRSPRRAATTPSTSSTTPPHAEDHQDTRRVSAADMEDGE